MSASKTRKSAKTARTVAKKAANSKKTASKTPKKKGASKASGKAKAAKAAARKSAKTKEAKAASQRRVFTFGGGKADGHADMKEILGGKGANLAEMTSLGIPVPPGFTISTDVCADFNRRGQKLPPDVKADVLTALANVEQLMDLRFGDVERPLLVSVRSGARASMPGMMDTVLNLGLNDDTVAGLAELAGERFAFDSYRRFIQMYGDVVLGVPHDRFEHRLEAAKEAAGVENDVELTGSDLRTVVRDYLEIVREATRAPFPQDPHAQLWGAIGAVFSSWENQRAIAYRRLNDIPDEWGTAVNVQSMVFGNMGDNCATGVAFTRNPSTGEKNFYGEYLKNAQGEDVVAGIRTPQPINESSRAEDTKNLPTLEAEMPKAYKELVKIYKRLEKHYRDMQDIEFTIQDGTLWMLQTRSGKRTTGAAVRIAVDMARERLITREEAIGRVDANSLDQLLHPTIDPSQAPPVIARGLPASPGRRRRRGRVLGGRSRGEGQGRREGHPRAHRDLTRGHRGHACRPGHPHRQGRHDEPRRRRRARHGQVLRRGLWRAGDQLRPGGVMRIGEHGSSSEGDTITIDGSTGEVMLGEAPTVDARARWGLRRADEVDRQGSAAQGPDERGHAAGCRGGPLLRRRGHRSLPHGAHVLRAGSHPRRAQMILAQNARGAEKALEKLLPMQRSDFEGIFRAMDGLPVTVRLLDPPLHEFLPQTEEDIETVATSLGRSIGDIRHALEGLHEFNPMLGHRGCRLGITYPEIYAMQVRAITEAAVNVAKDGVRVKPEIMIPLVAHESELARLRKLSEDVIADVRRENAGTRVKPLIGTMIEVPRAALTADRIAEHADFFSFGTNDLTQMGYALSRDDAGSFLPDYVEGGLIDADPFVSIDQDGIGQLVRFGVERGRQTRPDIKLGICGEHGGDPASVHFFAEVGLDYVSCSPYRVPLARLAAAQAAVAAQGSGD